MFVIITGYINVNSNWYTLPRVGTAPPLYPAPPLNHCTIKLPIASTRQARAAAPPRLPERHERTVLPRTAKGNPLHDVAKPPKSRPPASGCAGPRGQAAGGDGARRPEASRPEDPVGQTPRTLTSGRQHRQVYSPPPRAVFVSRRGDAPIWVCGLSSGFVLVARRGRVDASAGIGDVVLDASCRGSPCARRPRRPPRRSRRARSRRPPPSRSRSETGDRNAGGVRPAAAEPTSRCAG